MKILMFYTYRIIDSKGGMDKVFCDFANVMSSKGYDVLALAFENKRGKPFFNLSENVRFINAGVGYKVNKFISNLKSCWCLHREVRRRIREKYKLASMSKRVLPYVDKYQPDIIISFNREATYIIKQCLNVSVPVITMYHFNAEKILDDDFYFSAIESSECLQTLLYRDVTVTKQIICPKKIVTIPNAVPQFDTYAAYSNKKIISVGRIDGVQKRQKYICQAMELIGKRFPDWKVELWGEIYDKKYFCELKELLNRKNINNVSFCGVSNDIVNKLKDASIFAFPSAYEGLPLALTEAMSAGLPCVGFKSCPAVNELIKDGSNGILCDDTIEDFARGLAELMDDADKRERYGLQAKEDMKQYAPEKIWNQWEELINKIVREYRENNFRTS